LLPRNQLLVEVEGGENGGLWGEVALEVRCLAFLRGVRIVAQPDSLEIEGSVVGSADQPLELYVIAGRRPVAYATVMPAATGAHFRLSAERPEDADEPLLVCVDLVNGATVWYTLEQICESARERRPLS
jgi:hypothetical protein